MTFLSRLHPSTRQKHERERVKAVRESQRYLNFDIILQQIFASFYINKHLINI